MSNPKDFIVESSSRGWKVLAQSPRDEAIIEILIPTSVLKKKKRHSIGMAKELAYSVVPFLCDPVSIFQGIRENGEDDWYCYCVIPKNRFTSDGAEVPVPNGRLLLVYVTSDLELYNWYWSPTDHLEAYLPVEHETRFLTQLV